MEDNSAVPPYPCQPSTHPMFSFSSRRFWLTMGLFAGVCLGSAVPGFCQYKPLEWPPQPTQKSTSPTDPPQPVEAPSTTGQQQPIASAPEKNATPPRPTPQQPKAHKQPSVRPQPTVRQQKLLPTHTKKRPQNSPGQSKEQVTIGEQRFPVPYPWTGNRVHVPTETVARLQQIPENLTLDGIEIHLRREAIGPLRAMAAAARKDGIILLVDSAYRSARYQRVIFQKLMAKGRTYQDIVRYVAPPGYSEHSLGTVVDFSPSNWAFAKQPAYKWLHTHAAAYGFSETYHRHNRMHQPWEPWHWKFDLSQKKIYPQQIKEKNQKKGRKGREHLAVPKPVRPERSPQQEKPEQSYQ